jgi:lysophospholipase L1-like esterase
LFIPGAAALALLAACGGSTPPITPTPTAPQIVCPADVTVRGITGGTQAVTFSAPTVTQGATPVNVACTPASGATFSLGTSSVACVATDALSRQAACSFKVTLTGVALGVTTYEAFGDSLTEGEQGRPNAVPLFIDPTVTYPVLLQALFDRTFPGQGVTVINRGRSGDPVEVFDGKPDTLSVVKAFVGKDRPGAVLLLSGYNNLTVSCPPGSASTLACRDAIDFVPVGLRDCIRAVRELSPSTSYIFLSTLTPPGATGSNRIDPTAIVRTNDGIRQRAAIERVTLVDSYAAFAGHEAEFVNVDGLHLRPAGYQALADTFFAAIKATIPQTPLASLSAVR